MMNINFNLLPVAKKNRLEYITNFLLVKDILQLIILIGSILAATLIWSWIFLESDFADLTQSAASINREYFTYNQDVKNINNLTKDINFSNQNFIPITPKLTELINSLPNDIKINSLQIDRSAQTIIISGMALTRSALLLYQETVNKVSWIDQIETPVSQLFQKENINFEFKGKLENFSIKGDTVQPKPKPVVNESF